MGRYTKKINLPAMLLTIGFVFISLGLNSCSNSRVGSTGYKNCDVQLEKIELIKEYSRLSHTLTDTLIIRKTADYIKELQIEVRVSEAQCQSDIKNTKVQTKKILGGSEDPNSLKNDELKMFQD